MSINTRKLPFGTQDFIQFLGDELAFKLMEFKGGRYINVPPSFVEGKDYPLLTILSESELQLLIKHYASENLLVPKYDKIAKQHRDERIRELRRQGKTIDELAASFKLTVRQTYTIVGEVLIEQTETDLFGEQQRMIRPTKYQLKPVRLGLEELSEIIRGLEMQIMQHDYLTQNETNQQVKEAHTEHRRRAERALDKVARAKQQLLDKAS